MISPITRVNPTDNTVSVDKPSLVKLFVTNAAYSFAFHLKLTLSNAKDSPFKLLKTKILHVSEALKNSCQHYKVNSVLFFQIHIRIPEFFYNETSIRQISVFSSDKIEIPMQVGEITVFHTILPFNPVLSSVYSELSSYVNALLPITQPITSSCKYFPLVSWILNTQNTESENDFASLISCIPIAQQGGYKNGLVHRMVQEFCLENGFTLYISESFPRETIILKEDYDVVLFTPTMGENPFIYDCVATEKRGFYNLVSAVFECKGHYYAQVTSLIGLFEITESEILQVETMVHPNVAFGNRTVAILYVRSSMNSYFNNLPFWPHPIEKNPEIVKISDSSEDPKKDAFYFDFNKKYMSYPGIPSTTCRSKTVYEMKVKSRGQLVWRIDDKLVTPKYIEGVSKTASEICIAAAGKDTGVALIRTRGNAGLKMFKMDAVVCFPVDSLVIVNVIYYSETPVFGPLLVSFATKIKDAEMSLKYYRPPCILYGKKVNCMDQYQQLSDKKITVYGDPFSENPIKIETKLNASIMGKMNSDISKDGFARVLIVD